MTRTRAINRFSKNSRFPGVRSGTSEPTCRIAVLVAATSVTAVRNHAIISNLAAAVPRNEASGFLGGIERDRAGLKERERLAARTIVIDDCGNASERADLEVLGVTSARPWRGRRGVHGSRVRTRRARSPRGIRFASGPGKDRS